MPKQSVRVNIFNQSYTLLVEGDAREVETVAAEIDELMANIAARTGTTDSTRVAVLACLHLADQLRTLETRKDRIAGLIRKLDKELPEIA